MIDWQVELPRLRLGLGNCADYRGEADFVFTELYSPLPAHLLDKPMILVLAYEEKLKMAARWLGRELIEIGQWGRSRKPRAYVVNSEPKSVEIGDLVEDEIEPGEGCFPLALPTRLLAAYAPAGATIYDGCMGRGTVGKAALALGMSYVGVDIDPKRVKLAKEYLGCL